MKNILIIIIIAIILIGIGTWGYNYAYTKGKADGGNEFYQSIITSLQKEPYIYLPVTTQDGKAAAIKLGVFADEKGFENSAFYNDTLLNLWKKTV